MNPRLVKFVVELQNTDNNKTVEHKEIDFNDNFTNRIFKFNKFAKVTVPVDKTK